jgi:outer membrane protein assembly factor BamB
MSSTHRASLLILAVALLTALTFYQNSRGEPELAQAQQPASPPPAGPPDQAPAAVDLITLPTDRTMQKRIEAARDYIRAESWSDAIRLLQAVLDAREDVFIPVNEAGNAAKPAPPAGRGTGLAVPAPARPPARPATHYLSARSEANRLFGTLPASGLEFYQLQYGAAAKSLLDEAKRKSDVQRLDEAARRFLYTRAGAEAMNLLATYHLDRGRFGEAAFCFGRLLERGPADKIEPLTLFKAALAFHQSGDGPAEARAWEQLERRVGREGLRIGNQTVALAQLRREVERFPQAAPNPLDWPLFRGDVRRTAQAPGGVPYLDPRWQTSTVSLSPVDREARTWVEKAVRTQDENLQPSLPGAFPITAGGKVVYRSYGGIHAVDLKTGKLLWTVTMPLSLEGCLRDVGKKVHLKSWLNLYTANGNGFTGQLGILGGPGIFPGGNPAGIGGFAGFGGVPPGGGALGLGGGGALGLGGGLPPGAGALGFGGGALGALGGVPPGTGMVPVGGSLDIAPSLLFENSLVGTLSSDSRRVYAVEDLAVPPAPMLFQQEQAGQPHPPFGPLEAAVQHSRLLAIDLETGKVIWEIGGRGKEELEDCFFLGPPLPLGGKLYVLVEKQGEVRLVCLEPAKGEVAWSQSLVFVREKLPADAGRRMQAVHLAYADGVLVCPTNAGAVLGVDLLSRSLVWAHVYRERQPGAPGGPDTDDATDMTGQIGPDWKGSAPLIQDGKVVFTAFDSDAVRCLNLRDGALQWKLARTEDDQYLGGVYHGKVIVVGKTQCRAVSLKDGSKEVWKTPTGMPSGQGVADEGMYYLPLRKGAVAALDLDTGVVTALVEAPQSQGNGVPVPGNLLFHDGDLLSQSVTTLAAYPQLKVKLAEVEARVGQNSRDPAGLTERGELKLYQGDLTGAIGDLRQALANRPPADLLPKTRGRLYEAMTRYLQRDFNAAEKYLDEYRQLCRVPAPDGATPEQQLQLRLEEQRRQTNLLCLVARGREQQAGRLLEALHAYEDLYGHDTDGQLVTVLDDPVVRARVDSWVRGRIATLFAQADATTARLLHEHAAAQWQRIRDGSDLKGLARFASLYGTACPEGREARLLLAEQLVESGERPLEAELLLVGVRREREPRLAARATEALARLAARKGLPEDALHYYRALATDFPKVELRDGRTGAQCYDDLAADKRFLPYLNPDPFVWDASKSRAEAKPQPVRPMPSYLTFAPEGEDLPPLLRSRVLVLDLNSSQFKLLNRQTGAEDWSRKADLRGLRNYLLQSGFVGTRLPCQVEGHLVLVNLGAVIIGIDLLDRRVAWTRPLMDGPFRPDRMVIMPGDAQGNGTALVLAITDTTGRGEQRIIGRVGPLGSGHLVVQTLGGLSALDPVQGDLLWTRSDVAADADSFGDDRNVYLVERNGTGTRALRTEDGVAVPDVPDFANLYREAKARPLARTLLVGDDTAGKNELRLVDVHTGKDVWRKPCPTQPVCLLSEDQRFVGGVAPDGTLSVLDVYSGKQVLAAKVDAKQLVNVREVHLLADATTFYVVFNGPQDPNQQLQGDPWAPLSGMGSVPVNGLVYAFERADGKPRWFNRVQNQVLVVEQFEDLPILLFAAGLNRQNGGQVTQSLSVLSIDKRTGKRLYGNLTPDKEPDSADAKPPEPPNPNNAIMAFYALHVDVRGKTIELVSPNLRIRHWQASK